LLAHHLDVDGEAATFLGNRILQGPTDGVWTQREPGVGGHVVGVGLGDSGSHGAGGVLAGLLVHGEQGQLHVLALGPAQAGHQGVRIEVGRKVEAHREAVPPANVACGIGIGLRTGRHPHLTNRAGVHTIFASLKVDYLSGDGRQHQSKGDKQERT